MKKTDRYRLKASYNTLKNKELTKKIMTIIQTSHKNWLTKSDIYNIGIKNYGSNFPRDKNTILRYLNTMTDYKILEKKIFGNGLPNEWKIKNSPFTLEELVAESEINIISYLSKNHIEYNNKEYGMKNMKINDDLTIYGFPLHNFESYEKEYERIVNKFSKAMAELNHLAYIIYSHIWNKNIDEFLNQEDLPELDNYISSVFFVEYFSKFYPETTIIREGSNLVRESNSRRKIEKWFDFSTEPIVTNANLELAKRLKNKFYKRKKISEILNMIDNRVMDSTASNHILKIYNFPLIPIKHLIAVIHGGFFDRHLPHDNINAINTENKNQIIMDKQLNDKYQKKLIEIENKITLRMKSMNKKHLNTL